WSFQGEADRREMELDEFVDQVVHAEDVRLTAHVTDTYVATEISKFDRAEIPDMSTTQAESLHWLSNYIRNSVLRGPLPSPQRESRFSFLRHAMIAYSEHNMARYATLAFLESDEQSFGRYFTAIHHWEQFLAAAWLALDTLERAGVVRRLYEAGGGAVAEQTHRPHRRTRKKKQQNQTGGGATPGSAARWVLQSRASKRRLRAHLCRDG